MKRVDIITTSTREMYLQQLDAGDPRAAHAGGAAAMLLCVEYKDVGAYASVLINEAAEARAMVLTLLRAFPGIMETQGKPDAHMLSALSEERIKVAKMAVQRRMSGCPEPNCSACASNLADLNELIAAAIMHGEARHAASEELPAGQYRDTAGAIRYDGRV